MKLPIYYKHLTSCARLAVLALGLLLTACGQNPHLTMPASRAANSTTAPLGGANGGPGTPSGLESPNAAPSLPPRVTSPAVPVPRAPDHGSGGSVISGFPRPSTGDVAGGPDASCEVSFEARKLTAPETFRAVLPFLDQAKGTHPALSPIRLGQSTHRGPEGVRVVRSGQVLFAFDVALPESAVVRGATLELEGSELALQTGSETGIELLCLLDGKFCSGTVGNSGKNAALLNPRFWDAERKPGNAMFASLLDRSARKLGDGNRAYFELKGRSGRLDMLEAFRGLSLETMKQGTFRFAIADHVFVQSARLRLSLDPTSCGQSGGEGDGKPGISQNPTQVPGQQPALTADLALPPRK